MVHCREKPKDAMKWRVGYEAYKEAIKNGTTMVVVDGKDGAPGPNARPPHHWGQKSTKTDLAWEASAPCIEPCLVKDHG
jgi:hypothetical protein